MRSHTELFWNRGEMKINLGCGMDKQEGYINIDNRPEMEPDIIADILDMPFENDSVDEVRAFDVLEHIAIGSTIPAINEIFRVLKHDGIFQHHTPSTDGRGAFQDPTHVSFWNANSWFYFTDNKMRKLCGITAKFVKDLLCDQITDKKNEVIHTYGIMRADKGEINA